MKNVSRILPCYSADTAGVCSALYELGGMVVVHDASGCNSTYATHDEPRWEEIHSPVFISAMNEMDAIFGGDERLVADVTAAAEDLHPRFIALCGSPMPMMTGTDFEAAAAEIRRRTGIRSFALRTNGTHSYLRGASEAFLAVTKAFCRAVPERRENGVNLLGVTPLDLPWKGTVPALKEWLSAHAFSPVCCMSTDSSLDELKNAASARVSLVCSEAGLPAAEYLQQTFGIPFVCGLPYGEKAGDSLAAALKAAAETGVSRKHIPRSGGGGVAVIGERISAESLAAALEQGYSIPARVICPLAEDSTLSGAGDFLCDGEEALETLLAELRPETVFADPLYRFILPAGTRLIPVPHFAFSGRCFAQEMRVLTGRRFDEWLKEVL